MSSFIGKKHLNTLVTIGDLMNAVRSLKAIIPSGNSSLEWCLLTIPGGENIAQNNWQSIYNDDLGSTIIGNNYQRWCYQRIQGQGLGFTPEGKTLTLLGMTLVRTTTAGSGTNIGLVGIRWHQQPAINNVEFIAGVYMQSSLQEAIGGVTWGVFVSDWEAVMQPAIYVSGSGFVMDTCYLFVLKLKEE